MPSNELPVDVSVAEFARLVGLTPRRCRQLVVSGVAVASGRGRVKLAETIRSMLHDARSHSAAPDLMAARADLVRAKARQVELSNARADGALMDRDEVEDLFAELSGLFVSGLSGLPAAATSDPPTRRKIEAHCDAIRRQIVQHFAGKML
ncbi:MAG: Uncharacterized protein FD152_4012 [Xanthobacteraceae bacterium]|nr:MAG: Uncharacterized protein FD152_4012 [Xanthobacteraceae bacterium]